MNDTGRWQRRDPDFDLARSCELKLPSIAFEHVERNTISEPGELRLNDRFHLLCVSPVLRKKEPDIAFGLLDERTIPRFIYEFP